MALEVTDETILMYYRGYQTLDGVLDLRTTGTPFVPGEGPVPARVIMIGEAPGQEEARLRRPFVGQSGKLLDEMLKDAGIRRDRIFITNMVKYRPPNNRNPTYGEVEASKETLRAEVREVNPRIICPVGAVALRGMLPSFNLKQTHGLPFEMRGRIWLPLYHPSYALRRQDMIPTLQEDINRLKELIDGKDVQATRS